MNDNKPHGDAWGALTVYALGEVQAAGQPATRHAVAPATPDEWGVSACSAKARVWVYQVGGAIVPFPGVMRVDLACPECTTIVKAATPDPMQRLIQRRRKPVPLRGRPQTGPAWPTVRRVEG